MVEKIHTAIMEADVITAEMLVEIGNTIRKANERLLKDGNINLYGCCGATADELKQVYNEAFCFNLASDMVEAEKELIKKEANEIADRITNEIADRITNEIKEVWEKTSADIAKL